jgi:hypothetical protein
MMRVNRNEKIFTENLQRLNEIVVDEINRMQTKLDSVLMLNADIQQIRRGPNECQHTSEILVDAFLHAQDRVIQPQLITIDKVKDMMRKESLLDGLNFPSFSCLELSRLIIPIIFPQRTYFVYVFQASLLQPTMYQLYKLQPFPPKQQENVFVYTGCPRRTVPNFEKVFLMSKYTDITQNTYIQS